jgi:hypothetical protein
MTTEKDIIFEKGDYWVLRTRKGLEVLKNGATHSTVLAWIDLGDPDRNLERAKEFIDKRITSDK